MMGFIRCEECVYTRDADNCKDFLKGDGLTQTENGCGFESIPPSLAACTESTR